MRPGPAAVLASLVLLGCNGHFAFDQHAEEGADAASDARPLETGPSPQEPAICSAESAACACSGTFCSCARQQWCRFTGAVCTVPGSQCGFFCHNGSRCDGHCDHDCKLECEHESTCTMTLGENAMAEGESSVLTLTVGSRSRVHCENNATCHITCTGACSLECQSGARCDLRCAGEDAPRSADLGGSCPR
jgi:hypothetical protein